MATYELSSNVEFTNNYAATLPYAETLLTTFSAFSTVAQPGIANIVSVTISTPMLVSSVVNAGYYSHLIDDPTVASFASTFDIGFTSQSNTQSYYTTGTNILKGSLSTGGPSNASGGYGTLELGNAMLSPAASSTINFNGIDNTLILDTTTTVLPSLPQVTNFQAAGDQIVFNGVADSGAVITGYNAGTGTLTYTNGGASYSITFAGMASTLGAGNFAIGNTAAIEGGNASAYAGDLVISFVPCFLRGTMIDTPAGEVAVEALQPGQLVTVIEHGRAVARPVVWIGGQRIRATAFDGDTAYPIRIRAGAFAENVPHRDLLVTPEHCVLTDAGLTPARMLVNGGSIEIDRSISEYDFFHVELERHGILLSEGLTTESYLDSGNRDLFVGTGGVISARPDVTMAAPLAIARATVEPIWNQLADRSRLLGLEADRRIVPLTDQPDLRLLLDDGLELSACWHNALHHMFHLPQGRRPLRLLSRAAVPADVVGPFVDDRRSLGVAVERLVVWSGLDQQVMPLARPDLSGWHRSEAGSRWTDGNAELDLPEAGTETFLDIHLAATMLYEVETKVAA